MAKERVTPAQKPVPSQGGVREADHSTLTTPKEANGKYWGGKDEKNKIMK